MSEPELEFEIDEFGCIRYRVTNEGALLSKDEKEFIIDYVTRMQTENAKLRELAARMAEALGIDCEWADPDWCKSPCALEFGCWPIEEHTEIQCPAWAAMHELGVEVDA